MSFAREALPFVLPIVLVGALLLIGKRPALAAVVLLLAVGVLLFFRIPRRASDAPPGAVLAPANGKVTRIDRVELPELDGREMVRVATFLSVFDIHVQRSPVAGEVIDTVYTPGRKVAAFRDDADQINENGLTLLRTDDGEEFAVRQIAGLVARRVVTKVESGDRLERGQLFGLIKFGSRVDLFLPPRYEVELAVGDRVVEGQTIVAHPADE